MDTMDRLGDFLDNISEAIETSMDYDQNDDFVDLLDIKLAIIELAY